MIYSNEDWVEGPCILFLCSLWDYLSLLFSNYTLPVILWFSDQGVICNLLSFLLPSSLLFIPLLCYSFFFTVQTSIFLTKFVWNQRQWLNKSSLYCLNVVPTSNLLWSSRKYYPRDIFFSLFWKYLLSSQWLMPIVLFKCIWWVLVLNHA